MKYNFKKYIVHRINGYPKCWPEGMSSHWTGQVPQSNLYSKCFNRKLLREIGVIFFLKERYELKLCALFLCALFLIFTIFLFRMQDSFSLCRFFIFIFNCTINFFVGTENITYAIFGNFVRVHFLIYMAPIELFLIRPVIFDKSVLFSFALHYFLIYL